jgi:glycosyltransferase involved in cell wall biosynthesis
MSILVCGISKTMKVSIALCTYNGAKYLQQQLDSIVSQSRHPDELVICDDVSTDITCDIVEQFIAKAPFGVRLIRNQSNVGAITNFATAVANCTGDIVFLSDQDDVWRPDKIESIAAVFEDCPETQMVFTDAILVDSQMSPFPTRLWQHMHFLGRQADRFDSDPFRFLLTDHNVVTGAAAAFSNEAVQKSLPFPSPLAIFHDGWMALVASAIGPVFRLPQPLFSYRQHDAQQLGIRKLHPDFGLADYKRHYNQLKVLKDRVGEVLSDEHLELLERYIVHLDLRMNLPDNLLRRSQRIIYELVSGRYREFSSGIRSAMKDMIRRF